MTFLRSLSDDVRILLILAAFWLPVMLMCGVYTFRDARRFGKNRVLWALISAFAPCLIGFIAYLVTRDFEGSEVEGATPTGNLLKSILISVLLIPAVLTGVLAGVMKFTEGNYLFLTRFDTDVTVTDELLDPEYLHTDSWRSITRTNADGSTVEVQQHFGNFQITRITADGVAETIVYDVAYGSVYSSARFRYTDLQGDLYREVTGGFFNQTDEGRGSYFYNEAGQLYLYQIESDRETEQNHCVMLFYDEAGRVIKQQYESEQRSEYGALLELTPDDAKLRYDLYAHDPQDRVIRPERYDYADRLVSTTEYLWSMDDTVRIAQVYTPAGNLIATSVSTFDSRGQLAKQEFFDGDGNWLYTVEFGNDVVAFLMLDSTTMMLMVIWAVTMMITIVMLLPEKKRK